jgi:hypothetical protein
VNCAENLDSLNGACRELVICVREGTSYDGKLQQLFPSAARKLTQSHMENFQSLELDECNVVADSSLALPESIANGFGYSGVYKVGEKRFSKVRLNIDLSTQLVCKVKLSPIICSFS